jgi:titin
VINTSNDGVGSLRQAILDANASPGPDTITFNITTCMGVCVIQPASALPPLEGGEITIDGYSQPGAVEATATTSATILIEIDGTNAGEAYGLHVTSTGNVVRGLAITNFAWDGIRVAENQATGNTISGNHIGTGADGTSDGGNALAGVRVTGGAQFNTIGGDEPGERNVISGNDSYGVELGTAGMSSNFVSGNYIGTDASGTVPLPNGGGVRVSSSTQHNTVGGDVPGERNVISGNAGHGISIYNNPAHNTISGNFIGIDASGSSSLTNNGYGVVLFNSAQNNTIGGDTPGEGNVISANSYSGVRMYHTGTMSNTVEGNYIGTDSTGTHDLGNGEHGVHLDDGAQNNTIGEGNVISGNDRFGILINAFSGGASGNVVVGNYIGTDATGQAALGNSWSGVALSNGAQDNIIGPGNIIANNVQDGVQVGDTGTTGNAITQNSILGNDTGISLYSGAHGGIEAPVVTKIGLGSIEVTGTACASCTVELFANGDDDGEGENYLGSTPADGSGGFTVTLEVHPGAHFLTATATDPISGTSEFSAPFETGLSWVLLPVVLRAP